MTDMAAMFEPLRIRSLTIANRFVMSPANRNSSPNGIPDEALAQYFRRRVDGGIGLVTAGGVGVDHPASVGAGEGRDCAIPVLHGDAALAGWRRVVELAHAGGGKIVPQLWHMGVMREPGTGYHPEAKSSRPSGIWGPLGRSSALSPEHIAHLAVPVPELTDSEILEIIEGYARSARNAIELGFDGIAIHGANGYLPDSFLWAETNLRTDRWGGDRRQRARFSAEVIRAVRRAVGEDFPIFYRFTQWKHQDRNATLADTPAELQEVLEPLADAGVDVFDAAQARFDTPAFAGSDLNLAGWAKKITGRLSMTGGSVGLGRGHWSPGSNSPLETADNLDAVLRRFERGEFDLIGTARAVLSDAAWARKLQAGEPWDPYEPASLRAVM
jgi:2,4-dienoyl-CoA reductase-like NADH-dependent reductase (Old Yellow Enzyme family)